MFNFYIREEFNTITCNICNESIGNKGFKPLQMADIPSAIFECYYCNEYFIIYDGRIFIEYDGRDRG